MNDKGMRTNGCNGCNECTANKNNNNNTDRKDRSERPQTGELRCPVCGKSFRNVVDFANHVSQHAQEEKNRIAEAKRIQRECQQKLDAKKIESLYNKKNEAEQEFNKALSEYKKNYGGFIFPYDSIAIPLNILVKNFL